MASTLLLADDSVTVQKVIELTFADEDITVVAVGDGDAAIARLNQAPPDIVLADVGMPGRDGYAVAAHVHDTPALAHIPVLLLAGAFEPVDEARARAAGSAGVLVKPFEPQMVIARVRELLGRPAKPAADAGGSIASAGSQPASPVTAAAGRHASTVDDYFEQLDAAFASINATLDAPRVEAPPRPRSAPLSVDSPMPGSTSASSPERPLAPGPAPAVPKGAPPSMADAFSALLALEQGEPAPFVAGLWAPAVNDDVVEEITRRVTDRVTRELAPAIIAEVAERVVREEIAKLKAEARTL